MHVSGNSDAPVIAEGFTTGERARAAALFWQAFGDKLTPLLAPEARAVAYLSAALCPDHAIAARTREGRLIGLAGVKTGEGGLFAGTPRDLAGAYGWPGALWRGALLSLLEEEVPPGVLVVDGLFVDAPMRGRGVGGALIAAVKARARRDGLARICLQVDARNHRARAFYARHGFVAGATATRRPQRHLLGVRHFTEMQCNLPANGTNCRDAAN